MTNVNPLIIRLKLLSVLLLIVFVIVFILVQLFANVLWWNRFLTANAVTLFKTTTFDYIIVFSLFFSFVCYLFYNYYLSKNFKLALSKSIFYFSLFMAIMVWFDVEIMNSQTLGFSVQTSGFPWWEERVMTISCLFPAPNFTAAAPNCYFVNYADLFVVSVVAAVVGYYFSHMVHVKRKSSHKYSTTQTNTSFGSEQDYSIMRNLGEYLKIPLIIAVLSIICFAAVILYFSVFPQVIAPQYVHPKINSSLDNNNLSNISFSVPFGDWAVDINNVYGVQTSWNWTNYYDTPSNNKSVYFDSEAEAIRWLQLNGYNTIGIVVNLQHPLDNTSYVNDTVNSILASDNAHTN